MNRPVKLLDEPLKSPRPGHGPSGVKLAAAPVMPHGPCKRPAGITPGTMRSDIQRRIDQGSQPASRIKPLTEAKVIQILNRGKFNAP